MGLADKLASLFALVSLYLRLFVLRAQHFFVRRVLLPTAPGRSSGSVRTMLLLGDDTAEGVGDTPGLTGVASGLTKELRTQLREGKLRMLWHVLSAGRFGTGAKDWAADSPLTKQALKSVPEADVIVLLLGMRDDLSDGKDAPAVRLVADAALALARPGRQVLLPRLPDVSDKGVHRSAVLRANEEIERLVREGDHGLGRVTCAADIGKASAMGMDALRREGDSITLNPRGYRILCGELSDEATKAARRVEWASFKQRMQG